MTNHASTPNTSLPSIRRIRTQLLREFTHEYHLQASIEVCPDRVEVSDRCARLIIIGRDINGWRADVYATRAAWAAGEQPAESDYLDGDTAIMIAQHAIAIANRVPSAK